MTLRHFEDLDVGEARELGETSVTEDEIVAFAETYDPQRFHTDRDAARETPVGELIASGWHTAAVVMRVLVDGYLDDVAVVAAAGIDDLVWREPVRPGDVLSVSVEVVGLNPWNEERGLVEIHVSARNQEDVLVHERVERVVVLRRDPLDD